MMWESKACAGGRADIKILGVHATCISVSLKPLRGVQGILFSRGDGGEGIMCEHG